MPRNGGDGYRVDHSTLIYLMDRQGRFLRFFPWLHRQKLVPMLLMMVPLLFQLYLFFLLMQFLALEKRFLLMALLMALQMALKAIQNL